MSISKKNRIIALVDMDCFYVQVVQRNDPSLIGKPCAVVQYKAWRGGGIIAVGYEARKFGVTRQMRGDDAKQKCPEIALVHVPESRGKADLTQFREAGAEVINVLAEFTDCLERASIDEAYMDLSNSVITYMEKYTLEDVALLTFQSTHLVGLDNIELKLEKEELLKCDLFKQWLNMLHNNEENYHLAIGAVIANDMRTAVKEKTGFSCSAGVGPNKALAKLVAGFHKPNQQTLVLPENVSEMFSTTKMKKVRSLGGKLGFQLEEKLKVQFMSDLCKFSLNALQSTVGEKNGELVYWLCRGIDHEPVRPRQLPKSVGCSKNFRGKETLRSKTDVYKWLGNLVEEVWERLVKEKENNNRVPTLFTVGCWNENKQNQSKRVSIIKHSLNLLKDEAFRSLCEMNKSRSGELWMPGLTNLSFCASKFEMIGLSGSSGINKYMCSVSGVKVVQDDVDGLDAESVNSKKILSTKAENKVISNYFSSKKRDLRNLDKNGSADVFTDNSAVSSSDCENITTTKAEDKINHHYSSGKSGVQKAFFYNKPRILNSVSVPSKKQYLNSTFKDDFSNYYLSEDPLDFSRPSADAVGINNIVEHVTHMPVSPNSPGLSYNVTPENYMKVGESDSYPHNLSSKHKYASIESGISFPTSASSAGNNGSKENVLTKNATNCMSSEAPNFSEKHDTICQSLETENSFHNKLPLKEVSGKYQTSGKEVSVRCAKNSGVSFQEEISKNNEVFISCLGEEKRYDFEQKKLLSKDTIISDNSLFTEGKTVENNRKGYFAKLKISNEKTLNASIHAIDGSSLKHEAVQKQCFASNERKTASSLITESKPSLETKDDNETKKESSYENCSDFAHDEMSHYASEDDIMSCEKCEKRILVWDLPEHMDYHYAKDIQDSMKRDFLSLYKGQSESFSSPQKKKNKPNNSVMNYFSRVKK